ncbi:MAG: bifunctional ornithine acetyltransferase/N-acetylglutamate synthase, partial [Alcanivorax sp.]|nr:bifunctional ornithine acetyltransferase/N-acetylglutamate synthase [Alcanivorax sp.]
MVAAAGGGRRRLVRRRRLLVGHAGHPGAAALREATEAVAIELARDLARDGEGARTLIEVKVEGAATLEDARRAARTISSSPLIKTLVTGRD